MSKNKFFQIWQLFLCLKQEIDGAPLPRWTGKTQREGIGHKGGHDLTAVPGCFQAKLPLARLTENHPITRSYFPEPGKNTSSFSQSLPIISFSFNTAALLFQGIQGRIWAPSHHPLPRILKGAWEKASALNEWIREIIQSQQLVNRSCSIVWL